MRNQELEEQVRNLLAPLAAEKETAIDAVTLNEKSEPPLLQVTIDRLSGTDSLPLDEVAELARVFSVALDAADPLEGEYQFEVGTPGAESDLLRLRHYERNLGRQLKVRLRDGERLEGRLVEATESGFTLEMDGSPRYFEYGTVRRARASVQFGKGGR